MAQVLPPNAKDRSVTSASTIDVMRRIRRGAVTTGAVYRQIRVTVYNDQREKS